MSALCGSSACRRMYSSTRRAATCNALFCVAHRRGPHMRGRIQQHITKKGKDGYRLFCTRVTTARVKVVERVCADESSVRHWSIFACGFSL
eukprot:15661-Eustigmatos_ZCMA.PRE.1